ncbi:MAG: TerB family tellurite resistance protein [Myxococcota bacterium]|nr:TerB family tellurite resistance protein [Myxococcota bacterium]
MSILRWLGFGGGDEDRDRASSTEGETRTVRAIAERLERLPPEQARYLAAFAYVLARVAHADMHVLDTEAERMREIVQEQADLDPAEAELVVEIAKSQARLLGGTENYVVTREFRRIASRAQRGRLLDCLFAVAAADGEISAPESTEIANIGEELGFTRPEVNAVRARWREHLSELRARD